MKIDFFSPKDFFAKYNYKPDNFPFTFLEGYSAFLKENYNTVIQIACSDNGKEFIAVSINKSGYLSNAQLVSEPFSQKGSIDEHNETTFIEKLLIELNKQNIADRLIPPLNFVVLKGHPKNTSFCRFGTYVIDLAIDPETLLANLHSKNRNVIVKAQKSELLIKEGIDELPVFYDMYKQTMKRSDLFCEPYSKFESLYRNLGSTNCYCAVVYHNGQPQGAILNPYTKYCCYYMYGSSSESITESGAINYLHWHTILKMKSSGVRYYDFVGARLSDVSGTKLEGIQRFKQRFGGKLVEGYLIKADLNKFKCKTYDFLVGVKNSITKRKPYKDIIDQEIEKSAA